MSRASTFPSFPVTFQKSTLCFDIWCFACSSSVNEHCGANETAIDKVTRAKETTARRRASFPPPAFPGSPRLLSVGLCSSVWCAYVFVNSFLLQRIDWFCDYTVPKFLWIECVTDDVTSHGRCIRRATNPARNGISRTTRRTRNYQGYNP